MFLQNFRIKLAFFVSNNNWIENHSVFDFYYIKNKITYILLLCCYFPKSSPNLLNYNFITVFDRLNSYTESSFYDINISINMSFAQVYFEENLSSVKI